MENIRFDNTVLIEVLKYTESEVKNQILAEKRNVGKTYNHDNKIVV